MKNRTRYTIIREKLAGAVNRGDINNFQSYSPGDRRGKRWVIIGTGLRATGEHVFSTAEVECFLIGVESTYGKVC